MPLSSAPLSIAAVERETGLSKDTLRVWERRYRFPLPRRDGNGERTYPPDQVEKLRLIKKLMDRGYRPGKLVDKAPESLRALAEDAAPLDAPGTLLPYIAMCRQHRVDELKQALAQSLLRMGMYAFVTDVVAPLTSLVGAEWANGRLAVFEEHLYTEAMQSVLRQAIAAIPASAVKRRPLILLSTTSGEPHFLGLLMAEAILTLEGAQCLSLGVQTPVDEIAHAAHAQDADIVALSFSSAAPPAQVLNALADLRLALPPHMEIWTGGQCPVLDRRRPPGITHLHLHDISRALAHWRANRPA
ncbi:MerR family transcriptional regulator [Noviherbaspirillum sp. ST9]|uniref:MerR family transcriptional regulator n=1 Tax=Noviherbaspirillum sp. ST9 TaxID=3401606 RepID=UPI003B587EF5